MSKIKTYPVTVIKKFGFRLKLHPFSIMITTIHLLLILMGWVMLGVQYSDNVAIQQISESAFVLKINDAKVYQYLLTQCSNEFGWDRSIQKSQNFLNGDIEYHINVTDIPLESFGRDFFMLEPELLNNIAQS